jgi:hypothetical protein
MRILGVDPGGTGALALVHGTELLFVADMPVFRVTRGKSAKAELDVLGFCDIIEAWAPGVVFFEQVGGMTGESASAAFNFGRIAGAAEALCKAHGGRFEFVAPHVWKKAMRLTGTSKDDARAMATNRWPGRYKDFALKKHDGRAEAALLAEYGRQVLVQEGVFG